MKALIKKLEETGYKPQPFTMRSLIDNRYNNGKSMLSTEFLARLELMRDFRQITGAIDFECNFDSNGVCTGQYSSMREPKQAMCCCAGCAGSCGYHYRDALARPGEISMYKSKFNPYLGFWRPGKGCILERRMRSNTCVFFNCLHRREATKESMEKRRAVSLMDERARRIEIELIAQIKRGV